MILYRVFDNIIINFITCDLLSGIVSESKFQKIPQNKGGTPCVHITTQITKNATFSIHFKANLKEKVIVCPVVIGKTA